MKGQAPVRGKEQRRDLATRYISLVVLSRLGYRSRRPFPFLLLRPAFCFRSACFRSVWLFFDLTKSPLPLLLLLLQAIQLLPPLFTLKLPTTFWQVNLLRFVHCWNSLIQQHPNFHRRANPTLSNGQPFRRIGLVYTILPLISSVRLSKAQQPHSDFQAPTKYPLASGDNSPSLII